jgi:hypothetical protein
MGDLKGFANVVFPARDLEAGIAAWSAVLGEPPAFQGSDFAVFSGSGVELGLTAAPWVEHPLERTRPAIARPVRPRRVRTHAGSTAAPPAPRDNGGARRRARAGLERLVVEAAAGASA